MDAIRAFEFTEMAYQFNLCSICNAGRLEMKMASQNVCFKCFKDKSPIKMFSNENNMDPQLLPVELKNLTFS
jgi:hypothetical protein